ncbi:TF26 protein, partial [Atlantisia rogersi]|nr:TF26 protein [Atlantisia rogersi]
LHQKTHWATQSLIDYFETKFATIGMYTLAKQIVMGCLTCQRVNKNNLRKKIQGGRELSKRPFERIQIDFTDLPKLGRYRHLLVIVDHFTHFVEAFPTSRATSQIVARILLEEIIPRYGIVWSVDSDRGPHFTSQVTQNLSRALGIRWELHTPYHPQSSGKVERMNGEIKKHLTKLMIETGLNWVKCLPLALLYIRTCPRTDVGLSPYKILYGMPFDFGQNPDPSRASDKNLERYLEVLNKRREQLRKKGLVTQRPPLDLAIHRIQPGDQVLIKSW